MRECGVQKPRRHGSPFWQNEGGFQLPSSFSNCASSRLAVEAGYAHERITETGAIKEWTQESEMIGTLDPLMENDGSIFSLSPKVRNHPACGFTMWAELCRLGRATSNKDHVLPIRKKLEK